MMSRRVDREHTTDRRKQRWCCWVAGAILSVTSSAPAEPRSQIAAPAELRAVVIAHFAAEAESVRNAIAAVDTKLREGDLVRAHRLAAAVRILRARSPHDASPEEQMVAARRVAAARLLLHRDAAERRLLLGELTQLRADTDRIAIAAGQAADVPLPNRILRPARGAIRRRFGDYVHEPTKAKLSRRGVDFEVQPRAASVAPADGVVRFAGAIRGYDQGVILDHGHFLTVVAKLGDVTVPVGARVAEGDKLGNAIDRHVYLEVRVKLGPGGLPIDPEPLLSNK